MLTEDITLITISPTEFAALRAWATKGINAYANEAARDNSIVSQMMAVQAAREAGLDELANEMERDFK